MSRSRALSIVELLVLLCALGMLTAVVLPALAHHRAQARSNECRAHLRTIAQAWEVFAADFDGRGPGYANNPVVAFMPQSWTVWLNHFVWGDDIRPLSNYMAPIQRFNGWSDEYNGELVVEPGEDNLACPEIGTWEVSQYSRPYIANLNAVGGRAWGDDPFPHGKRMHQHPFHQHAEVWLGTRIEAFHRPASRFMVFEADRGNDQDPYRASERNLLVELDDELRSTRQVGGFGQYMFRHPNLTMNVAMMDGRVHRLTNDPAMFGSERFSVD